MSKQVPSDGGFDWGEMVEEVAEVEEILARLPRTGAKLIAAGSTLLSACVFCLVVGRLVVRVCFPDLVGKGLTTSSLAILIPVWSLGVVGVLLLLAGQVIRWRAKRRDRATDPRRR